MQGVGSASERERRRAPLSPGLDVRAKWDREKNQKNKISMKREEKTRHGGRAKIPVRKACETGKSQRNQRFHIKKNNPSFPGECAARSFRNIKRRKNMLW